MSKNKSTGAGKGSRRRVQQISEKEMEERWAKIFKKKSLCSNCGVNEAKELHTCPYKEDINDDSESLCDCCSDCLHECSMDI